MPMIRRRKMRLSRFGCIISIFALLFCPIFSINVQAINTVELESIRFEQNPVDQGNQNSVIVDIKNYLATDVSVKELGIHLDWQNQGEYTYCDNIGGNPLGIKPNETKSLKIGFGVPANASVGKHECVLSCRFVLQGGGDGWTNVTMKDLEVKPGSGGGAGGDQNTNVALGVMAILIFILIIWIVGLTIVALLQRKKVQKLQRFRDHHVTIPHFHPSDTLPPPQSLDIQQQSQTPLAPPPEQSVSPGIAASSPPPPPQPESSSQQSGTFSNCPYCGRKFTLRKQPRFCPYCNEDVG